jgi:hypothetical protein
MSASSSPRERLAAVPAEARRAFLAGLPAELLAEAAYDWPFWAGPISLNRPVSGVPG